MSALPDDIWYEIFSQVLISMHNERYQYFDNEGFELAARFVCTQRLVCLAFCNVIDADHIWEKMLRIWKITHHPEDFTWAKAQVQYLLTLREFKIHPMISQMGKNHTLGCFQLLKFRPCDTPKEISCEILDCLYNHYNECIQFISDDIDVPIETIDLKIDGHIPLFELIKVPKYCDIYVFGVI
jgi:hypothetical protein